jgi:hypothetical protein
MHLTVILVERPDHCASVPPGPGRIVGASGRFASDRVHRSWCWRVGAALPQWLLAGFEPQREIARLRASGEMPRHPDCTQKPVPRQQFEGVGPQGCGARVVSEHVMHELGDNNDLHILVVQEPERHQPVAGLLYPADPGDQQPRDIPNRRAMFCHTNLRWSP